MELGQGTHTQKEWQNRKSASSQEKNMKTIRVKYHGRKTKSGMTSVRSHLRVFKKGDTVTNKYSGEEGRIIHVFKNNLLARVRYDGRPQFYVQDIGGSYRNDEEVEPVSHLTTEAGFTRRMKAKMRKKKT
jgi:hypothetical protein